MAHKMLDNHMRLIETWLSSWRIKVNENKCKQVTFTLNQGSCPAIRLNNIAIPVADDVIYLGIHLDRRLTWRKHIEAKKTQINLKTHQLHWLLNANSKLNLEYKLLIYNSVIKPIWTYGCQLWSRASTSNIGIIQRAQSKILRTITGAPWYMRNANIHRDLQVEFVEKVLETFKENYRNKLGRHKNPLARNLHQMGNASRLRRFQRLE